MKVRSRFQSMRSGASGNEVGFRAGGWGMASRTGSGKDRIEPTQATPRPSAQTPASPAKNRDAMDSNPSI
ncbi:hypothetical protein G6F58_013907 [Rhizopus delemar]|nr:hypothetical protein G6F58_013907 [Rhizopus delemar]